MNNFGVIEVAGTATKATPGWAYVPDTGPALPVALQPKNRKRAARNQPGLSLSDLTVRQENKLRKDLEALNKDNHRDVSIPIPHKTGGSRPQNKHTPNVRKILQSQKTFANHLDDYQALLALAESNPAAVVNNPLLFLNKPLTPVSAATPAKSASPAAPTPPAEKAGGSKRSAAAAKRAAAKEKEEERKRAKMAASKPEPVPPPEPLQEEDVEMVDIPPPGDKEEEKEEERAAPSYYPPDGSILPAYKKPPPAPHPGDNDPLLVSVVPSFPTDEELRALMTAPPLSYMEARASFGEEKYPTRVFCEMCGYWGRVKCMKCGVRVCGLDCLEGHREECVTRYGL
ncbi:hypothetical protein QBC36DRAFT_10332 [Triangularia setosa]|uniref:HIT-type domain-containing protein n=1 Tax=Triangularia setosa TaxID=2587417 RepID=A0AAN6W767_9PEZI|nr:hypothetical protein QBC36DRAFT_10332 [Podospora setosa]